MNQGSHSLGKYGNLKILSLLVNAQTKKKIKKTSSFAITSEYQPLNIILEDQGSWSQNGWEPLMNFITVHFLPF